MSFTPFAQQVNKNFNALQGKNLLSVNLTGDELWALYLASFPEGANPMFRERTEHDCNTCRQFVKALGGVVYIDPVSLEMSTVWDKHYELESPYSEVAQSMRLALEEQVSWRLFRVSQPSYGAETTKSLAKDGAVERWTHLWGVPAAKYVTKEGAEGGEYATSVATLHRAFNELNPGAVNAVLDLITEGQLYRGDEHKAKVERFRAALGEYHRLGGLPIMQARFLAVTAFDIGVARFQGSVIGTLVEALAIGEDVEAAVRSFEVKVAPQNYQRTKQIVTQKMVDDALAKIDELGVKVGRRFATIADVSVENVLWVDGGSRPLMKDGLAGILAGAVKASPAKVSDQVVDIGIDAFIGAILPTAQGLRVLVEGSLSNNFMALTTATEAGGPPLFKWDNSFAWSYAGGVTDSIQERVKAAGGNVNALLRFSLSWFNYDDLDLRCIFTPTGSKSHEAIYFGNKSARSSGLVGGLDVDMNAGCGKTREAVENIAFTKLAAGKYEVRVNNYSKRESVDVGFTLQLADTTGSVNYTYGSAVADGRTIECIHATVDVEGRITYDIGNGLTPSSQTVGNKWGLTFDQYADVSAVMLSPNHWDGHEVGNKHTFFLLRDAKTDEQPRGLYNEFLHPDLHAHRRVFDVIGERTKPELSDDQLTGIGVSSTLRKSVVVEVATPTSKRAYRVQF